MYDGTWGPRYTEVWYKGLTRNGISIFGYILKANYLPYHDNELSAFKTYLPTP